MRDNDKNYVTPAERFRVARDTITRVLENPRYIEYAVAIGPLTMDDLDEEAALRVVDVAGQFGWPTSDDAVISPPKDFTDSAFVANLFERPSTVGHENALNNFSLYLRAHPIESFHQASTPAEWYGLSPVVHRANALAPELFTALRDTMNCFDPGEQSLAKSILAGKENTDVVTALNMGYRIMGRLLKTGDLSIGVRDAHETLTA